MIESETRNIENQSIIGILFSVIMWFSLVHIIIKLTKCFKYHEKQSNPNLWDYFGTLFTLGFGPFGLLIMHSHLQLILKDQLPTQ